jgi:hypothetical protein
MPSSLKSKRHQKAAKKYGIDLSLLDSNLRMAPTDRIMAHQKALEFALLLLLMLIFTPLSFGYLYVWLLYPFTVIVQRMLIGPSAGLVRWTGAAVVLLALTIPNPRMAQTYGSVFFATLLLFIGLANELWRLKREKIPAES